MSTTCIGKVESTTCDTGKTVAELMGGAGQAKKWFIRIFRESPRAFLKAFSPKAAFIPL